MCIHLNFLVLFNAYMEKIDELSFSFLSSKAIRHLLHKLMQISLYLQRYA